MPASDLQAYRSHLSPGGYLDPTESDEDGLISRLDDQLGIPKPSPGQNSYEISSSGDWKVEECLSVWWRANFDTFLVSYIGVRQAESY